MIKAKLSSGNAVPADGTAAEKGRRNQTGCWKSSRPPATAPTVVMWTGVLRERLSYTQASILSIPKTVNASVGSNG